MAALVVEALTDPAVWKSFAQDGATPSGELVLTKDVSRAPPGSASSVRVAASSAALDHTMRCDLGPLDLRAYDDLRLSIWSDRIASGSPDAPFFLEMRLGSAGLPPGDPANRWRRMLPVSNTRGWEQIRVSLADLDPGVRAALTRVQLRVAAAGVPFTCNLAALAAVREELLGDVDQALKALLHARITIDGTPVPAVLHPANGPLTTARPYFEILHMDVYFSGERTQSSRPRGDFTGEDYSLMPQSFAYELYYQITAVADDRAAQASMLELALRTLRPRGDLIVNGCALPMEMVVIPPRERIGAARTDQIPLFFKISARQEVGAPEPVRAARTVIIESDMKVGA